MHEGHINLWLLSHGSIGLTLQETKVKVVSNAFVRQYLGNKFEKYFYLPAVGTRGGILLACDVTLVTLSNPHTTVNTITALMKLIGALE